MTDNEQTKIFASNLRYFVNNSGKQQKEIANDLGFAYQTFNGWCKGVSFPSMDKIQKMADYFKIGKSDLLDKRTNDTDLDLRRIERARTNMSDEDKSKMMNILEAAFKEYF